MYHTLVILCVVSSLLIGSHESASVEVNKLLKDICDHVQNIQNRTQGLLDTYLSNQGAPFNGSHFSAEQLQLDGLPKASIPYRAWRRMTDEERLLENYQAYSVFQEYFQLVLDDQRDLSPDQTALLHLLDELCHDLAQLLKQLSSAFDALRLPRPLPIKDPLSSLDQQSSPFQRRLRGYLVFREYRLWLLRTHRSFTLLGIQSREAQ
ncbi:cardiotrophin-2-like [Scyliorhinus canicula]|uniref:cardiotrophin-2-like n=1 Tax=Scyliorhinus canicula TaxID=7830 RepID=UPI0018F68904|nr:cardiotrophin-2-like [Scyliorhinus canicula]